MPLGTIPKLSLLEPQNPSCLKLNSVRLLSAFPAFASFKEGSITIDGSAVHFTGRSPNQRTLIPWDAVSYVGIFDKLIGHPLAKRVSILAGAYVGSMLVGLPLPFFIVRTRSSYNPRNTAQASDDLFIRSTNHSTVLRFSTHRGPIDILVRHTLATRFVFELRDFLTPLQLDHLITTTLPTSYEAAPKQSVGERIPEPTPIQESEIAPNRVNEPYIANPIDAVVCSAHYPKSIYLGSHPRFTKRLKGTVTLDHSGVHLCDKKNKVLLTAPWNIVWSCDTKSSNISYRTISSDIFELFSWNTIVGILIPEFIKTPVADRGMLATTLSLLLKDGSIDFQLNKVWVGEVDRALQPFLELHKIHRTRY